MNFATKPKCPRITVTLTLAESILCNTCPNVIPPFSAAYVIAVSFERPTAGTFHCEKCFKKEMEQRSRLFRDWTAMP